MEPGPLHASPTGQLLVERGLMSQDQLEDALLEQRVSRKRLGSILVHNRVVTPHDLTAALQRQIHAAADDQGATPDAESSGDDPPRRRFFRRQPRADEVAVSTDSGAAQVRQLVTITEEQNHSLREELARRMTELALVQAEAKRQTARVLEVEAQLEAVRQERRRLTDALRTEISELENDLRALRTDGIAPARQPDPAPLPTPTPTNGAHLILTPNVNGGLDLRRSDGPPPAVGNEIELDGRRFRVVSHRRSPLAVDDRACIHVQPS